MPGLSSLQVNIKDQPHNLAWINEAEQALLKDLGGSGRPGPMGIPAYPFNDFDDPEGDFDDPSGDFAGGRSQAEADAATEKDITEEQSRAAVQDQLGRNYDPESLATPDVPSYGFDSEGEFGKISDIGGIPQGAFATAKEHADYFFSKRDGRVKEGVFDRNAGVPDIFKASPALYAALSFVNKITRTVDPEEKQGTLSNITFSQPPDPFEDEGDEEVEEEIIEEEEAEEETPPPLGTMEQYFKDREDAATTAIDETKNMIDRLGIQNRTIEPFNKWLAEQSQAMQAADMTTQTNEYRKSLRDQTSSAQSYLPLVHPIKDRITEQKFINNLYRGAKRTPATQALFDELGI